LRNSAQQRERERGETEPSVYTTMKSGKIRKEIVYYSFTPNITNVVSARLRAIRSPDETGRRVFFTDENITFRDIVNERLAVRSGSVS